jgi:hypothetical protein
MDLPLRLNKGSYLITICKVLIARMILSESRASQKQIMI